MFRKIMPAALVMVVLGAVNGSALAQKAAKPKPTPNGPGTGPYTIQMLTPPHNVILNVNPPTTFTNGEMIRKGTAVKIRVYRSTDGGVTYKTPVELLSGGQGSVGQGAPNSKPWIELTAKVPVDNKAPYTVYLAVTAVVDGVESPLVNSNLQFRYWPSFVRYATPAAARDLGPGLGLVPGPVIFRTDAQLTKNDPFDTSRKSMHRKVYPLKLEGGKSYQIDMESGKGAAQANKWFFDTYLRIEDGAGKELKRDDDGGEGLNARIVFMPPSDGVYNIIATSFGAGATGDFRLTVRELVSPPPAKR